MSTTLKLEGSTLIVPIADFPLDFAGILNLPGIAATLRWE